MAQAIAMAVLAEVDAVFSAAGIASLPVKGVVTSRLLYRTPAERELRDVDVRIGPERFADALTAAKRANWPLRSISNVYGSFVAEVGGMDVDVETTIGPPGFCGMSVATMLSRSHTGPEPFRRTPDIHDHALVLVVNAVKDHWVDSAPYQIEDLRRIVRLSELSTSRLRKLAEENGCAFMLHVAARFLRHDVPEWEKLNGLLDESHPRRAFAVGSVVAALRKNKPKMLVRVLSRLVPDSFAGSLLGLGRAGLFVAEERWNRARLPRATA